MEKDFDAWNSVKKRTDAQSNFQHPKEREVWWCSIGVNVGTEIYGKGIDYTRPVLVINSENAESCLAIPLTSKLKNRKYSCVIKTSKGTAHSALVFQVKNMDKRRFLRKISTVSDEEYLKVKGYFDTLYKIL